jgi:HSP20 family molecular chaperone IbpA
MVMKKRSFFERLSGSGGDDFDTFEDDGPQVHTTFPRDLRGPSTTNQGAMGVMPQPAVHTAYPLHAEEEPSEGQLPVDVYQTPSEIVIRTFIAGVRPDEVNVSISRDMVTIEGAREERATVSENDYFHHELFWGSFARTILLPQEIDVENSSAGAKDGLLTVILPKLDKAKQTKLRVKAS